MPLTESGRAYWSVEETQALMYAAPSWGYSAARLRENVPQLNHFSTKQVSSKLADLNLQNRNTSKSNGKSNGRKNITRNYRQSLEDRSSASGLHAGGTSSGAPSPATYSNPTSPSSAPSSPNHLHNTHHIPKPEPNGLNVLPSGSNLGDKSAAAAASLSALASLNSASGAPPSGLLSSPQWNSPISHIHHSFHHHNHNHNNNSNNNNVMNEPSSNPKKRKNTEDFEDLYPYPQAKRPSSHLGDLNNASLNEATNALMHIQSNEKVALDQLNIQQAANNLELQKALAASQALYSHLNPAASNPFLAAARWPAFGIYNPALLADPALMSRMSLMPQLTAAAGMAPSPGISSANFPPHLSATVSPLQSNASISSLLPQSSSLINQNHNTNQKQHSLVEASCHYTESKSNSSNQKPSPSNQFVVNVKFLDQDALNTAKKGAIPIVHKFPFIRMLTSSTSIKIIFQPFLQKSKFHVLLPHALEHRTQLFVLVEHALQATSYEMEIDHTSSPTIFNKSEIFSLNLPSAIESDINISSLVASDALVLIIPLHKATGNSSVNSATVSLESDEKDGLDALASIVASYEKHSESASDTTVEANDFKEK